MEPRRTTTFPAIGTSWSIDVFDEVDDALWARLLVDIQRRIEQFDHNYSRFRQDSLVSKLARAPGVYELPEDAHKLLSFYDALYKITDGQITPTIGSVLQDLGYDEHYSFQQKEVVAKTLPWDEVVSFTAQQLTIKQPVLLDFGAAGKGYLADIVAGLISAAGMQNYVVNASGDIVQRSSPDKPIVIGLQNPLDATQIIGTAQLSNQSLCASSGSKRQWGNYHHIVNPQTQQSPSDILATWTIADEAMIADGLATALFFTAPQKLLETFRFSYAILKADMSLEYARDFPVEVYQEVDA